MHRFLLVVTLLVFACLCAAQTYEELQKELYYLKADVQNLQIEKEKLERTNQDLYRDNQKMFQDNKRFISQNKDLANALKNCQETQYTSTDAPYDNQSTVSAYPTPNGTIIPSAVGMEDFEETSKITSLRLQISNSLQGNPSTFAKQINLFNNQFDTYIIDLRDPYQKIQFFWRDKNGNKYHSLGQVQRDNTTAQADLLFATNGGMYDSNQGPKGLLVQNGIISNKVDIQQQGMGNFYLQPNGLFFIDRQGNAQILSTQEFLANRRLDQVLHATQSGPMLLNNGAYHPDFRPNSTNRFIRNGVGIIDEHRVVFAISKQAVNFYDFAKLFKEVFNCQDALFLDGAVSKMYCPELNRFDSDGNFGPIIGLVRER